MHLPYTYTNSYAPSEADTHGETNRRFFTIPNLCTSCLHQKSEKGVQTGPTWNERAKEYSENYKFSNEWQIWIPPTVSHTVVFLITVHR
mmetsp:Transcript_10381/g.13446  ORF Transcript_10381/g.13446 Transcript_10381/m.13446 type:complete len:89 (+) Transcript_10381:128-394(+)